MQIVQIGRKPESLNGSFDVLLDMRGGVGDGDIPSNDVETTLGGNYQRRQLVSNKCLVMARGPTENLVADVVLPDEVSQKLFIHTGLVDNSSIPECAAQFNCLQQDWFSFFEAQIATQTKAQTHGTEARCWDLNVAEGKCLDHVY